MRAVGPLPYDERESNCPTTLKFVGRLVPVIVKLSRSVPLSCKISGLPPFFFFRAKVDGLSFAHFFFVPGTDSALNPLWINEFVKSLVRGER